MKHPDLDFRIETVYYVVIRDRPYNPIEHRQEAKRDAVAVGFRAMGVPVNTGTISRAFRMVGKVPA